VVGGDVARTTLMFSNVAELLMMKETRCLPREQQPPRAAPPKSLPIEPHATYHAKHCITSLDRDSLMPLPSQSPVALPKRAHTALHFNRFLNPPLVKTTPNNPDINTTETSPM